MKCRWGQVEYILPSKASPSYGKVRDTDRVHLVLVARKPADAGKASRPVHAGDLCRKCVVSRRTLRSMMGQEGCLPLLQTHYGGMLKVEAWPQQSSPCFCAKESKERFAKVSSNTPRPHITPQVDLSSLFVHSHKYLSYILCFVYPSTKHTIFFKNVFSLSSGNGFFCFVIFLAHEILQNPIVSGRKMKKFSPGESPRDPLPSSDTTQTPPPATPLHSPGNLLDLVLTNSPVKLSNLSLHSPIGKSDHLVVFFTVSLSIVRQTNKVMKLIWCYDKANISALNSELKEHDWSFVDSAESVDDAWDSWKSSFLEIISEHVPSKKTKKNSP